MFQVEHYRAWATVTKLAPFISPMGIAFPKSESANSELTSLAGQAIGWAHVFHVEHMRLTRRAVPLKSRRRSMQPEH